jgi:hypothetical protein
MVKIAWLAMVCLNNEEEIKMILDIVTGAIRE